jgi:hypothetical protein
VASADTPDGTRVRTFFSLAQNVLSAPEVDSEGIVYVAQNPNGSQCWIDTGSTIFDYLNLNPHNSLLMAGGQITYGQPCLFQDLTTGGQSL